MKIYNISALLSLPFLIISILSFFIVLWPTIFSSIAIALGIFGLALVIKNSQVKGKIISITSLLIGSLVFVLAMIVVFYWLNQSYNGLGFTYGFLSVILIVLGYLLLMFGLLRTEAARLKLLTAAGIFFLLNAVYLYLLPRVIL